MREDQRMLTVSNGKWRVGDHRVSFGHSSAVAQGPECSSRGRRSFACGLTGRAMLRAHARKPGAVSGRGGHGGGGRGAGAPDRCRYGRGERGPRRVTSLPRWLAPRRVRAPSRHRGRSPADLVHPVDDHVPQPGISHKGSTLTPTTTWWNFALTPGKHNSNISHIYFVRKYAPIGHCHQFFPIRLGGKGVA